MLEVVGESHYQEALKALLDEHGREITVIVDAEPGNPYDPNAVRIADVYQRRTLGHIPREAAARYQPMLRERGPIERAAKLFGGTKSKPSIGIWVEWGNLPALLGAYTRAHPKTDSSRETEPESTGCASALAVVVAMAVALTMF